MNFIVLMKQTFDTEEKIILQNGTICEDGVKFIINPYDEFAIKQAIKLRDLHGGKVTVITIGPKRTENALKTALDMGADQTILVDSADQELDEYSIAKVMAAILRNREFDLILVGNMAVDNGSGQVGPRLAEDLDIPQITNITYMEINGNRAIIERETEEEIELVEVSLPVLVTVQQCFNEPWCPSKPGIMKNNSIDHLEIEDLIMLDEIEARTVVTERFSAPVKENGLILNGDIQEQVAELATLLCDEPKVNGKK